MIRGAQKRMIVLRTRDSRVFEEAYFVLRREADGDGASEQDMIREANRILERSLPRERLSPAHPMQSAPKAGRGGFFWFAVGILCGGGGTGAIGQLLHLL